MPRHAHRALAVTVTVIVALIGATSCSTRSDSQGTGPVTNPSTTSPVARSTPTVASERTWVPIPTTNTAPSPRDGHWMTYDPADHITILFGGKSANSVYDDDTWTYRSADATWTRLNTTGPRPSGRFGHTMVYATAANQMLMFGGATTTGPSNDLWAYHPDTTTWQALNPTGNAPAGRLYPSFGYDPITGTAIVFGGWTGTSAFNDTWTYEPTTNTWTQLDTNPNPPARWGASLVYDPTTRQLIMFGGLYGNYDGQQRLNDTWAFDPANRHWTELTPKQSPPARGYATIAAEPSTGNIILFGGFAGPDGLLDDTWSYNPTTNTWSRLDTNPTPPRRDFATMIDDTTTDHLILFGGLTGTTGNIDGTLLNDTWTR